MRKILLLGNTGQVGWELNRALMPLGEVVTLDAPELDFTDLKLLREQVLNSQAAVIVNAAAYTAVDKAESQPELAMKINGEAPGLLAELARETRAVLVHYSTDFVYDGTKGAPYTEDDSPHPLSIYGKTKLAGDCLISESGGAYLILRTSWVYSSRRDNFVKKVLGWARTKTELSVVSDQIGCPTWARDLAEVTAQVLAQGGPEPWDWLKERSGLYHLAGSGYASRYEWVEEILKLDPQPGEQTVRKLNRASSADFPAPAQRPTFSALDCTRLHDTFGLRLPDWRVSLRLAMDGS